MSEYAPDAIEWLGQEIVAACGGEISGIMGDSSHTYGYHRCRNVLPADDYSVQLTADQAGDGWAASALDVTLPSSMMPVVTQRLLDSAKDKNDPRLDPVREFFGTLDHQHVTGWDCVYYTPATSDTSHVWHVHISILRKYANDMDAMRQILSVVRGDSLQAQDDDMDQGQADALARIERIVTAMCTGTETGATDGKFRITGGAIPINPWPNGPNTVTNPIVKLIETVKGATSTATLTDQQLNTLADLVAQKLASQAWHVTKA